MRLVYLLNMLSSLNKDIIIIIIIIIIIVFCLFVIFIYFPFWFKERDLPFDCSSSCSLLFYYFYQVWTSFVSRNCH